MRFTDLSTDSLLRLASARRDALFGTRVTYSPKVFIPLTRLCRDRCGYCTFAESPRTASAPYLEPDEVIAIAEQGAAADCHEALFTLGEGPELRYLAASQWLADRGHITTIGYLAEMTALVLAETGLLPHANAGAIGGDDLALLRRSCASQGMMVESLRGDLVAHCGAPNKAPARRLGTPSGCEAT